MTNHTAVLYMLLFFTIYIMVMVTLLWFRQ